jgi:ribosomal subunit interface protein
LFAHITQESLVTLHPLFPTIHWQENTTMKLPVQIQFHGLKQSPALEQNIREHVEKLETFFPNIIACRVAIELEQKHAHQGRPFHVRVDLTVPGHELVVNRVRNEDVHIAMRDAFDDMQRQLEDFARKRRGQKIKVSFEGL